MTRPGLPPKYYQVESAARQAEAGEISTAAFLEFLKDIVEEFEDGEDEIQETELPEHEADDLEDDLEDGLDGIDVCKSALERLSAFAEDKNPEHLKRGLSKLAAGLAQLADTASRNDHAMAELELIQDSRQL